MQTQTITVIGATGSMGSAIAKSLAKSKYRLLLASDDKEKTQSLAKEIKTSNPASEVESLDCSHDASWEADIIILAVPYSAESEIASKIKNVVNQKIVVSIANPLNETFDGLVTPPDSSAAEELQKLLPNARVVKAFNTTFAADFSTPVIGGSKVDAFVAGNDTEAVDAVSELVSASGFNPLKAGKLAVSGTLERMQLLLIQLGIRNNYNWLAGWKILHQ